MERESGDKEYTQSHVKEKQYSSDQPYPDQNYWVHSPTNPSSDEPCVANFEELKYSPQLDESNKSHDLNAPLGIHSEETTYSGCYLCVWGFIDIYELLEHMDAHSCICGRTE